MINGDKNEILERLSKIDDVIFVGGTSEFLQGIKKELRDIDISVKTFDVLREIGYIHKNKDYSFHGASGERGFIPLRSVLIDVFIDEKIDFIAVNGFKCEVVSSMLERQEKTLEMNAKTLLESTKEKLKSNINRLKSWQESK
ncbi:hypothetical protein [Chryseobacterium gambrini]|uniref:hypothetical protein n=1 Tax=Chryseobacterium gambrini TaxID=373672 RepID=UPI003D0DEECB